MDTSCLVLPHRWDFAWQLVGLLRARLGRLVVLGPRRERIVHALASRYGAVAFGGRGRKAKHVEGKDHSARNPDLCAEPARHLPGAFGCADVGTRFRHGSSARRIYPRVSGVRRRWRPDAVRGARADAKDKNAVRADQPRGWADLK